MEVASKPDELLQKNSLCKKWSQKSTSLKTSFGITMMINRSHEKRFIFNLQFLTMSARSIFEADKLGNDKVFLEKRRKTYTELPKRFDFLFGINDWKGRRIRPICINNSCKIVCREHSKAKRPDWHQLHMLSMLIFNFADANSRNIVSKQNVWIQLELRINRNLLKISWILVKDLFACRRKQSLLNVVISFDMNSSDLSYVREYLLSIYPRSWRYARARRRGHFWLNIKILASDVGNLLLIDMTDYTTSHYHSTSFTIAHLHENDDVNNSLETKVH